LIRSEANFKPLDALRHSIWVGSAIIFLAFGALPLLSMMAEAVRTITPAAALRDPLLWPLLGRTLGLSLAVAAGATVLGTITGYFLGATSWRGKTLARIVLILPLAVPPYLHAIGWTTFLRPRGSPTSLLSLFSGFRHRSFLKSFTPLLEQPPYSHLLTSPLLCSFQRSRLPSPPQRSAKRHRSWGLTGGKRSWLAAGSSSDQPSRLQR